MVRSATAVVLTALTAEQEPEAERIYGLIKSKVDAQVADPTNKNEACPACPF